jgi:hypothetical protein
VFGLAVAAGDTFSRAVVALIGALSLSILADSVSTHAAWWMTAKPGLSWSAVQRRRSWWGLRLRPWQLKTEERRFQADLDAARADGRGEEAAAIEAQLREVGQVRYYALGFVVPVFVAALAVVYAPLWLALTAIPLVAVTYVCGRAVAPNWRVLGGDVLLPSIVLWFSWGRWESYEALPTPGLFRSPRGPAAFRLAGTLAVFVLLSLLFVPAVQPWGTGSWTFVGNVLLSFFAPVIVVLSVVFAAGACLLWTFYSALEGEDATEVAAEGHSGWEAQVARLLSSSNELEREHLWLGVHAEANYPVLLHRSVLWEHGHIIGDSGSGKTARGVTPLVTQIIRQGDSGMVVVDLKGDMALFEAVREEAQRSGRTLKFFTNVLGKATHVFNPYRQTNDENVSFSAFVEFIMEALRLNHGEGYGKRFFTAQGRSWLLRTVTKEPDLESFAQLFAQTDPDVFGNDEERSHVLEVISVLQQLAVVEALNWTPRRDDPQAEAIEREAIRMAEVVRDGHIVYFWLPAAAETSTVREIAYLAVYALFIAARAYYAEHGRASRTFLFIDEFQRIASAGFELILQQSRSFGLAAILANQTISDLRGKDRPELLNVVQANTRFRQIFSATDPRAIEQLVKDSGEILLFDPDSERYRVAPRMSVNDVKHYSSDAALSIVHVTRDSGFSCFGGHWFGVKTGFHISEENYKARTAAPWPEKTDGTIVARRRARPFFAAEGQPQSSSAEPELVARPEAVTDWRRKLLEAYARRNPRAVEGVS